MIIKQEPELVVIYPKKDLKERKEIINTPQMPDITVKALLKDYKDGIVTFNWKLTVKWENIENYGKGKRIIIQTFTGTTTASNSNVSEWKVDWQNKTRGGKDITLEVTASAGGKEYSSGVIDRPFEILGMNPTSPMVKEGLNTEEQVIVYMESSPKWKHFVSDFNFPIFGDPHGYGLMQLDYPRSTDEQVWNWKANKAAGKALLASKKIDAQGYPGRIRAKAQKGKIDLGYLNTSNFNTDELIWKETFQRYNGGGNWYWKPDQLKNPKSDGKWIQRTGTTGYGVKAWDILTKVKAGTLPIGW